MFRPKVTNKYDLATASERFALYVEGPRDRDVLRLFAKKLSPELAAAMDPCVRILGGRQPDRAARLFERLLTDAAGAANKNAAAPTGLCVLDRDDPRHEHPDPNKAHGTGSETGGEGPPKTRALEFVVWKRRQIESYLMVPSAIRRCVTKQSAANADHQILDQVLARTLPDPDNEAAFRKLDAKRVLGARGPIASFLGRPLRAQEIVRNMTPLDVHPDVKEVLARVRDHIGNTQPGTSS